MTTTAIDAAATFREDPAKARSAPTVTATLANGRARLSARIQVPQRRSLQGRFERQQARLLSGVGAALI